MQNEKENYSLFLATFAWSSMDAWYMNSSVHRGHVEFVWTKHSSIAKITLKEFKENV